MSQLNPNSPFFHEERYSSLAAIAATPITVCGAGALGGNVTETLARMGYSRLTLIDRDKVELRNLSTQPYSRAEIGAPKARVLANCLYRAVQAKVEPVVAELTAQNAAILLKGSRLVIDALDNRAGRAAISAAAQAVGFACLHIGFSPDGLYGNGLWEPGYSLPHDTESDPCDYPLTRPLALMLAALTARAVTDFLQTGAPMTFELTLTDMQIAFGPHGV